MRHPASKDPHNITYLSFTIREVLVLPYSPSRPGSPASKPAESAALLGPLTASPAPARGAEPLPLDFSAASGELHRVTSLLSANGTLLAAPSNALSPGLLDRAAARLPGMLKHPLFRNFIQVSQITLGAGGGFLGAVLLDAGTAGMVGCELIGMTLGMAAARATSWILMNESPVSRFSQTRREFGGTMSMHLDRKLGELQRSSGYPTLVHAEETFRILKYVAENAGEAGRFKGIKAVELCSPLFLKSNGGKPELRIPYRLLVDRSGPETELKPMNWLSRIPHYAGKLLNPGWKDRQLDHELSMRWKIDTPAQRENLLATMNPIVSALDTIDSISTLQPRQRTDLKGEYIFLRAPNIREFLEGKRLLPDRTSSS